MDSFFQKADYNTFLALLFIYSSSVDLDLANEEQKMIIDKVGLDVFNSTLKQFKKMKDIEVTDTLYDLSVKFCSTEDQLQLALKDIEEIIHAEGRKSRVEEDMIVFIKRILKN